MLSISCLLVKGPEMIQKNHVKLFQYLVCYESSKGRENRLLFIYTIRTVNQMELTIIKVQVGHL